MGGHGKKDLEEKTETASLDRLYENSDPMIYAENDVEVQVNGYRYYKIQNFTRNLRIPFGDQNAEGGVIVLAVTIQKMTQERLHIMVMDFPFPSQAHGQV